MAVAAVAALTGPSLPRQLLSPGGDSFCSTSTSASCAASPFRGMRISRAVRRGGARSPSAFSTRSARASQEGATSTRLPSEYDVTDPQSAQSSQPTNEVETSTSEPKPSSERASSGKPSKGNDGIENSDKASDSAEKPEAATKPVEVTDRLEEPVPATNSSQQTDNVEKSPGATKSVNDTDREEKPSTTTITSEKLAEKLDSPKELESASKPEKQATTPKPGKESQEPVEAKQSSEKSVGSATPAKRLVPSENEDSAKKPAAKTAAKKTSSAASEGGAKRAPKAAAKKPVQKSLEATMLEDVGPMLTTNLSKEDGLTDIDITFEENQLKLSFAKGGIPYCFWVFFPDGDLEGSRGFSLTSHGSPPSTIEPFLIDEKKLTPEIIVFWITKRLFVQKLLSIN